MKRGKGRVLRRDQSAKLGATPVERPSARKVFAEMPSGLIPSRSKTYKTQSDPSGPISESLTKPGKYSAFSGQSSSPADSERQNAGLEWNVTELLQRIP